MLESTCHLIGFMWWMRRFWRKGAVNRGWFFTLSWFLIGVNSQGNFTNFIMVFFLIPVWVLPIWSLSCKRCSLRQRCQSSIEKRELLLFPDFFFNWHFTSARLRSKEMSNFFLRSWLYTANYSWKGYELFLQKVTNGRYNPCIKQIVVK